MAPRRFDAPFLRALREDDDASARALYDAAPLRVLTEDVDALPPGVLLRPRHGPLTLGELRVRLRSWEQLDRAYEPTDEPIGPLVAAWLDVTGLCLDWGDDHVFVTPDGAAFAAPDETWDAAVSAWARGRGIPHDPDRARATLGDAALVALHARARVLLDE